VLTLAACPAFAGGIGHADMNEVTLQKAVTPIAEEIHFLHNDILFPIIVGISLLVLGLLLYCMWRFNEKANPVPSRTSHNTLIEVIWAVCPVIILIIIAIPSFRLLTHQLVLPQADLTIKAIGKQWNWAYEYPKDQGGGFSFDSEMKKDSELDPSKGDIRLLAVDNEAVVPVNKVVRVQVVSEDVIHSFVVQSFGIRIDAVPGRLNETWFKADRVGIFYGQCSKLCGKDHAFMPIAIRVVTDQQYAAWLASAKQKFASADPTPIKVAATADAPLQH
jgi:cytochrome c oxidase subunit 2